MHRWIPFTVLLASALAAPPKGALAAPPAEVAYQGRLLDDAGGPLEGPVDLEIRVFDGPTGGAPLYRELHAGVALADGVFDVALGTGSGRVGSFDAGLFADGGRWLEVVVDGEVLAPRQAFRSVAYALQCDEARAAGFAAEAGEAASVGGLDGAALRSRVETLESQNASLRDELEAATCRLDAFEERRRLCEQPIDPGPCAAAIPRWAFDPVQRRCTQFNYGGCGGGDNNFATQSACESACVARPVCP